MLLVALVRLQDGGPALLGKRVGRHAASLRCSNRSMVGATTGLGNWRETSMRGDIQNANDPRLTPSADSQVCWMNAVN
jgi:hypothetical protein